ncbi:lysine decarboxylation/transport transcriptional activator CadC [Enterobacter sp. LM3]|uniref:Lysine decarboxylation/transport transcriptional activator CadC n=1 Tax=Enterobacter mori TaxID=539813 RepID=A0A7T0DTY9_9ENTR|nr:lysine decarboxylation/transport transcriptional activator CadC [Enterobacter mori]QPJ99475.1 lysine decarboxylation/transport transcriptional activator CadC [Enterobacter mori]BBS38295.1 transcriptional regulator CadC [Enterobacter cloacae]
MQQPVVRVGDWLVTPSVNQISRQGRQLTLEPRLIDLLMYFARHPDEVLSRDELIDNIWMRNIVTSHVVTQSISELRKSLKDGNEQSPEYIATVPKRGYKLTATAVWCTEEEPDITPPSLATPPAVLPIRVTETQPQTMTSSALPSPSFRLARDKVDRRKRIATFWTWLLFLSSLGALIALVLMSLVNSHPPVTSTRLLLNPRDIDVRFEPGNSCNSWTSQQSYAIGLGNLITTSLNTFSTFMVHDKTNYNVTEPSSSGKTLTIKFVNQRHYRAQQCFMSVLLVDNADSSIMLDKRYFITDNTLLSVQEDLLHSLSSVLTQPWPPRMQALLEQFRHSKSMPLAQYYQANQLIVEGDVASLNKASEILEMVTKDAPDFTFALSGKILVDVLRHSQQQFDKTQLQGLNNELDKIAQRPGVQDTAPWYQIQTIDALTKGDIDDAYTDINKSIDLEMSWLNYVLLGKVYEMKGENRLAADAYITAFNLRPGDNTLYWIENGVFHTSIKKIVPYLQTFLKNEQ